MIRCFCTIINNENNEKDENKNNKIKTNEINKYEKRDDNNKKPFKGKKKSNFHHDTAPPGTD